MDSTPDTGVKCIHSWRKWWLRWHSTETVQSSSFQPVSSFARTNKKKNSQSRYYAISSCSRNHSKCLFPMFASEENSQDKVDMKRYASIKRKKKKKEMSLLCCGVSATVSGRQGKHKLVNMRRRWISLNWVKHGSPGETAQVFRRESEGAKAGNTRREKPFAPLCGSFCYCG